MSAITGCEDGAAPPPIVNLARPVKTFVLSTADADAGIELPGQIRALAAVDLAFNGVDGQIVELPALGREGQQILQGELLAQLEPKSFESAVHSAKARLGQAYPALELAQIENARMEKMKSINLDLVSASMLERTRNRFAQVKARIASLEAEVERAENQLEGTSLRAPFRGVVTRCLVENHRNVKAGEPIVSLRDIARLEVVVDAPETLTTALRKSGADGISLIARFPSASGVELPLTLTAASTTADPAVGPETIVLIMPKPNGIDLKPGATGIVTISGQGLATSGPTLAPAVAVMTDANGEDYVWVVDTTQLRVHRREVRIGRLAGANRIQILSGLRNGERIVAAGGTQLAEGQAVHLWENDKAGNDR